MLESPGWLALLAIGLLVLVQMRSALGWRGISLGAIGMLCLGSVWAAMEWKSRVEPQLPEDQTGFLPVTSQTCFKCHESHYASWQQTYHRTMTREATPEFVKADFNNATYTYRGVTSHMTRRGDHFFIDTIDPKWESENARTGISLSNPETAERRTFSVDRIVGSHWFQQMLNLDAEGRYVRMPLIYHIVEKRWIHINGAFLCPETDAFHNKIGIWNETCIYCHNTRPSPNPQIHPPQKRGPNPNRGPDEIPGFRTEVGELGIACEACHGAGERHVRLHQNPARRLAYRDSDREDPTIVNPARLSVPRADDVCAHCHGGTVPRYNEWNQATLTDPYLPGRELKRFWYKPFSESELQYLGNAPEFTSHTQKIKTDPQDSRTWGDGTPLTTAMEFQGLALSACYQDGHGKMNCLSCHSMHGGDPNHQLKEGMRTNEACYSCHNDYRSRLVEHTHHPAGSEGSLCYNCHMPYQVYSLLDTHRSHRITIPRVRDSLGTGKPHACNLCHLDKSLGWTGDQLAKWYGTKPEILTDDEKTHASSLLHLAQSDARTRSVVAGAFSWKPAQEASGRDWPGPLLTWTLENEPYPAVRYLAHRGLRSLHGDAVKTYDYLGTVNERTAQLQALRQVLDISARPDRQRYPYLPLNKAGSLADDALARLLRKRNITDVSVQE
ncbi:MAG TPA: cytochrome c3 family protein [Gemmata sp.]|jgi:predicted CXXCH cytochrome family protein|nr:cytochrome c3 family protein [Gemmata sp.]